MAKKRSASATRPAPSAEPAFVFRGTVQRVKDSTVADIVPDANTAVVRVDEVIAAPAVLARIAGREITVVTSSGVSVKPRQQALFYVNSLSFGHEVAVRAMRVEPLVATSATGGISAVRAAAAPLAPVYTAPVDPVQAHDDLQLMRSLDEADTVVTGTVTAIRMAPETTALGAPRIVSTRRLRGAHDRQRPRAGPAVEATVP